MSYGYKFIEESGILKVTIYGEVDQLSMRSRLTLLATERRWKPEYKLLIDYSSVTVIDKPKEFSSTLRDLLNEIPEERLPAGIAYIFPDRLLYQCFDPTHSVHSLDARCKVSFFSKEDAAINWLEKMVTSDVTEKGLS